MMASKSRRDLDGFPHESGGAGARMKRMRRLTRDENVFWWVDSFLRAGAKLNARAERAARRRRHLSVAR